MIRLGMVGNEDDYLAVTTDVQDSTTWSYFESGKITNFESTKELKKHSQRGTGKIKEREKRINY